MISSFLSIFDQYIPQAMKTILADIRQELRNNSDEKALESGQRFFKETIKSYGVKVPIVQKISKAYFKRINTLPKAEIWNLCDQLLKSGYMEEAIVACNWSHMIKEQYEPEDFVIFEAWINRYISNWAACDTLCNHTLGTFIEMYPGYVQHLKRFAGNENRWMRRAAAVSLIIPARKGKFLNDIFDIADLLLQDKDDMVQKGYGWMLKAASQVHQQEVFSYVMRKRQVMPRTALRYAIEKMPKEMKAIAMKKG